MNDVWRKLAALPEVEYPATAWAAVLVPLYEDHTGAVRVVLTKRPDDMRTHPGDVVFPGGMMEAGEDPVATATREAWKKLPSRRTPSSRSWVGCRRSPPATARTSSSRWWLGSSGPPSSFQTLPRST